MSIRPAVLITGGAKRVGAAMARYFAQHGYDIALHYHRSKPEAEQLKRELEAAGARCEIFQQDLADIASLPVLIESVKKAFPACEALINNASVFEREEFLSTDEALFDRQFDVNFKAPFFLTQAFVKNFGKGAVVNVIDTDIVQNQISHFAYLLSKKTLAEFTVMAARALGPDVRVNAVCPGCMLPSGQNDESYEQKVAGLIPMKSHPSLDELSEAVRWLIAQKHITGQVIFVDGGKHVI